MHVKTITKFLYLKSMSSFIGHSIAGAFTYLYPNPQISRIDVNWLMWLIFVAVFPDFDYICLWLLEIQPKIRFTHSIVFSSLLPVFSVIYLRLQSIKREYKMATIQVFSAAYSHLLLDLLVGVSPLPLLWPVNKMLFKLPFGILPSAGQIDFMNVYLYRNLLIELGILLPFYSLVLMRNKTKKVVFLNISILLPFIIWGISLQR